MASITLMWRAGIICQIPTKLKSINSCGLCLQQTKPMRRRKPASQMQIAARTQPLNGVSAAPGTPLTLSSPAQPGPEAARADAPAERPQTQPSAPAAPGGIALAWPVRGPVLESFDQTKNKGINIGGEAGAPIQASAAGRV